MDDREERSRSEGYIQARMNNEATFNSMPSGSVNPDSVQLTPQEKVAAEKMKISEKEYLEQKKEILKGE
jgi:hypothetical protein